MRFTITVVLILFCSTAWAEVHVSPKGSDSQAGSSEQPLASLAVAIRTSRLRTLRADRKIILHDGVFPDTAVTLTAQDSGLTIEPAPNARPVLIGGIRLSRFRPLDATTSATWSLDLPAERALEPRLLVVNGRLADRARWPESGTLTHLSEFKVPWMSTTGGGWKRKPTPEELTTLKFKPDDLPPSMDPRNAEITIYHMWDESRVGIASIDRERNLIRLSSPAGHPPGAFGVQKYVLWNIREGLTRSGQWCHDRAGNRILYRPRPGEQIDSSSALVPTTEAILTLQGTAEAPIHDVTIRGVGFSVTTAPLVAGGFAAGRFDGAITLRHARACKLLDLSVSNVGGHGIKARTECRDILVENCEITDCGAGGIYVGGENTVIADNLVRSVGLSYPSAIGIHGGGRSARVSHNEVHDTPYSAINFSGEDAIIEHNLLYDCMKVLHDGGAIYVFGGKRTILRRNVARDFTDTGGYGASAYYLDETSEDCAVEENISFDVGWPSHNHMARNNTIRRNVFVSTGDLKLTFPRSSGYTFEGNILFARGRIRIDNPDAISRWSKNILYSAAGKYEAFALKQYSGAGQVEAIRGDSVCSDPRFVNWMQGNFGYKAGSPALERGLPVLQMGQAGRRLKDSP